MGIGKMIAAGLLGGVKGGSAQHLDESKQRQAYALKQLEDEPSIVKTNKWIESHPDQKQNILNLVTAGATGVTYDDKGKKVVKSPAPKAEPEPTIQEISGKVKRYKDKKDSWNPFTLPSETPTQKELDIHAGRKR